MRAHVRSIVIASAAAFAFFAAVKLAEAQFVPPTCTPPNCNPQVIQNIPLTGSPQTASLNVTGDGGFGNKIEVGRTPPQLTGSGQSLYLGNVANSSTAGALLRLQKGGVDKFVVDINGQAAGAGFSGDGGALTNLNASNVSSGTLNDARLSTNIPLKNTANTFTGANTFSNSLNSFSGSFAGSGSALTSLNASNVSSGTLGDAYLSSNVMLKNANNTSSGNNAFSGMTTFGSSSLNLGVSQNLIYGNIASGQLSSSLLLLQTGSVDKFKVDTTGTLTVGSVPWARLSSFPAACGAGQFVSGVGASLSCAAVPVVSVSGSGAGISVTPTTGAVVVSNTGVTSLAAGAGISLSGTTGAVTVSNTQSISGTANYVAKFTGASALGNSIIQDNGTNVGVGTSPSYKLDVAGAVRAVATNNAIIANSTSDHAIYGTCSGSQCFGVYGYGNSTTTPNGGVLGKSETYYGGEFISNGSVPLMAFRRDSSNASMIPVLELQRATTGTSANGIGGSIRFLSTMNTGGLTESGQIGSILTNAASGSTAGALIFTTPGASYSEKVRIDNAGNVGIGTASPSAKLHVYGYENIQGGSLYMVDTGTAQIVLNSAASDYGKIQNDAGNVWSLAHTPTGGNTLGTPVLSWNASNNVGIGTMSPGYKLDVKGEIANTADSATYGYTRLESWGLAGTRDMYLEPQPGFHLYIVPNDWTNNLATTINGSVGINGGPVEIYNSGQAYMNIHSDNTSNGSVIQLINDKPSMSGADTYGAINFGTSTSAPGQIAYQTWATNAFEFRVRNNRVMELNGDGRLAITGPGSGGSSACFLAVGSLYQLTLCSSSARYKENIEPLKVDEDKVLGLQPVHFNWKPGYGGPEVGLIAEDVDKLLPEIVTYRDGRPDGVEYKLLSVYLLEIDKNLEAKVVGLDARQTKLEDEYGAMRQEIDQLKQRVEQLEAENRRLQGN